VERGRRLIGNDDVGIIGQRHRDPHTLALPAGELVRIVSRPLGSLGDTDPLEKRDASFAQMLAVKPLMGSNGLLYLTSDRMHGVKRGQRILEDVGTPATTAGNQLSLRHSEHIFSVQVDGTVADQPGWRVHQPHDRERSHTLAGAALADQTQAFSGTKMKGDILHRGCVLAVVRKAGLKPLYIQNG